MVGSLPFVAWDPRRRRVSRFGDQEMWASWHSWNSRPQCFFATEPLIAGWTTKSIFFSVGDCCSSCMFLCGSANGTAEDWWNLQWLYGRQSRGSTVMTSSCQIFPALLQDLVVEAGAYRDSSSKKDRGIWCTQRVWESIPKLDIEEHVYKSPSVYSPRFAWGGRPHRTPRGGFPSDGILTFPPWSFPS